jgi:hypothetical protein
LSLSKAVTYKKTINKVKWVPVNMVRRSRSNDLLHGRDVVATNKFIGRKPTIHNKLKMDSAQSIVGGSGGEAVEAVVGGTGGEDVEAVVGGTGSEAAVEAVVGDQLPHGPPFPGSEAAAGPVVGYQFPHGPVVPVQQIIHEPFGLGAGLEIVVTFDGMKEGDVPAKHVEHYIREEFGERQGPEWRIRWILRCRTCKCTAEDDVSFHVLYWKDNES